MEDDWAGEKDDGVYGTHNCTVLLKVEEESWAKAAGRIAARKAEAERGREREKGQEDDQRWKGHVGDDDDDDDALRRFGERAEC